MKPEQQEKMKPLKIKSLTLTGFGGGEEIDWDNVHWDYDFVRKMVVLTDGKSFYIDVDYGSFFEHLVSDMVKDHNEWYMNAHRGEKEW